MFSEFLGVMAGITILLLYVVYFRQVSKKLSIPNPATWSIWFFVHIINTVSYFLVLKGSVWQSLIAILTTSCLAFFFFYFIRKRKFASLGEVDLLAVCLSIIVTAVWITTKSSAWANVLLQVVILLSYIPTIIGLLNGTLKESPWAWAIGVLAYVFQISSLAVGGDATVKTLAFPIVNGLLGNGSVAVIAIIFLVKRKENGNAKTKG